MRFKPNSVHTLTYPLSKMYEARIFLQVSSLIVILITEVNF